MITARHLVEHLLLEGRGDRKEEGHGPVHHQCEEHPLGPGVQAPLRSPRRVASPDGARGHRAHTHHPRAETL